MSEFNRTRVVVSGIIALAAAGCGGEAMKGEGMDLKKTSMAGVPTYRVTITNLTKGQIFSPPLFVTGSPDAHLWQVGQPASPAVEQVAEAGVAGNLAEMVRDAATDVVAGAEPVKPGETKTIVISGKAGDALSCIAMLVRTNDGFTGLDAVPLKAGSFDVQAYDAGTEVNTEKRSDVPGPPFLGTGHVPTNPPEPIHVHPGIQGTGDLTADMGWTGPVAHIEITPQ